MKKLKGIDISHWNKVNSFETVKKYADFIILKAGGGDNSYEFKDPLFNIYYEQCKKNNIPVGAYYYAPSTMDTIEKGERAANCFLNLLYNKQFEMPVFLDLESTQKFQKIGATLASIAFCEKLENEGYFAGIYASDISGFKERLQIEKLSPYTLWVARYKKEPTYTRNYGLWQYSSEGSIPGISGAVDLDIAYNNYPKIIKGGCFNGYT